MSDVSYVPKAQVYQRSHSSQARPAAGSPQISLAAQMERLRTVNIEHTRAEQLQRRQEKLEREKKKDRTIMQYEMIRKNERAEARIMGTMASTAHVIMQLGPINAIWTKLKTRLGEAQLEKMINEYHTKRSKTQIAEMMRKTIQFLGVHAREREVRIMEVQWDWLQHRKTAEIPMKDQMKAVEFPKEDDQLRAVEALKKEDEYIGWEVILSKASMSAPRDMTDLLIALEQYIDFGRMRIPMLIGIWKNKDRYTCAVRCKRGEERTAPTMMYSATYKLKWSSACVMIKKMDGTEVINKILLYQDNDSLHQQRDQQDKKRTEKARQRGWETEDTRATHGMLQWQANEIMKVFGAHRFKTLCTGNEDNIPMPKIRVRAESTEVGERIMQAIVRIEIAKVVEKILFHESEQKGQ